METVSASVEVITILKKLILELRPGAPLGSIHLDSSLEEDLAMDSLGRAELIRRIEEHFKVALPDKALASSETVRDLLRFIEGSKLRTILVTSSAPVLFEDRTDISEPSLAKTLIDVLKFHADQSPNRIFITFLDDEEKIVRITFKELWVNSQKLAGGLLARGLPLHSPVAIMLPTGLEFFYTYFGSLIAGAVPVPLYPPDRPSQIEDYIRRQSSILKNSQAPILVAPPEGSKLALLFRSIAADLHESVTPEDLLKYNIPEHGPKIQGTDTAFIQYTSGSTGDPKGVVLSHLNLLSNIRAMGVTVQASPKDIFVSWLPLYHDMGLIGACLGSLYYGSQLVLMSPLYFLARPARWLKAIAQYRGTLSAAPNFAYEICATRIPDVDIQGLDLSSWRCAFSGAEPVNPDTLKKFSKRFLQYGFSNQSLTPVYGLAECSLGVAFPPIGRGPKVEFVSRQSLVRRQIIEPLEESHKDAVSLVACGSALVKHEIRIVDNQNRELPELHVGRLQFRGPSATSGYYRNAKASEKLFQDGWLDSGDLAYISSGEIFITGRSKDMIIRAGTHIFPEEIEDLINTLPDIRKGCVAVFGMGDAKSGTEKMVVVVESKSPQSEVHEKIRERIIQTCREVAGVPPDEVVIAPPRSVLKTSSGKIRRNATRELYEKGRLGKRSASWMQWVHLFRLSITPLLIEFNRRLRFFIYGIYSWTVAAILLMISLPIVILLPHLSLRLKFSSFVIRSYLSLVGIEFDVRGTEKLDSNGSKIIVVNHCSYADSPIALAAMPGRYRFVAKSEFKSHLIMGPFLSRLGCIFVERFKVDEAVAGSESLFAALDTGESLIIFPEGTFTRQAGVRPFHNGAFMAAAKSHVPIYPVAIRGSRNFLRDGQWLPRRTKISVEVFNPIQAPSDDFNGALLARDNAKSIIVRGSGEPELW